MSNQQDYEHERADKDLSHRHFDSDDLDYGDWTSAGPGGGGVLNDSDTGLYGLPSGGFPLDMGDSEGDHSRSHDALQAFNQATKGHLPYVTPGRRPKALGPKTPEKVTEEDFEEGAERNAFILIMHFAHKLLSKSTSTKAFLEGLQFFFKSEHSDDELSFDLCAEVLGARPDVFRLRVQYEWWLRGTMFTGPLDFSAVGLPQLVRGEVMYRSSVVGYALSREIWVQPGIKTNELLEVVGEIHAGANEQNMTAALEALQACYMLSKSDGWYFTGRNPLLMNQRPASMHGGDYMTGGSVHWTRLFGNG